MTYTAPTTRSTGDLITASIWNTDIVDNLVALKDPPDDTYTLNEASNYTTTSTSFTDIDATNLSLSLTTTGGDVLVHFHGTFGQADGGQGILELLVDGVAHGGDDGICAARAPSASAGAFMMTFTRLISLSAGSHTIKLQWKVPSGTVTLYAGAGTLAADVHPQFWAREVS